MTVQPPAWCQWRRGQSAVLVVAPHGGRRDPAGSLMRGGLRTRKVNDLHTADLAAELADLLDAGLITNPAVDRNQLDLNRISQVAIRAPWFLTLIESLLDDILARHHRAEVLVVHGWNVIQPKCDVGVGAVLPEVAAARAHAELLTVSPAYAAERLHTLQAQCAAAGIATTFGVRYPARHPNNFLQLFRHSASCAETPPRLAAWSAAGRIEAVQLELGVPVRWPGPYRRAFLAAVHGAFAATPPTPIETQPGRTARRGAAASTGVSEPRSNASLQLYDPAAEIALTARIERSGPHITGRLLVFQGRQRLALFIGEDSRHAGPPREGPHFANTASGFRLQFAGTALASDDGAGYVDIEQGFAASRLCAVVVDLEFCRRLSSDYGSAAGWVEIEGERHAIDVPAFARHAVLQGTSSAWSSQLVLSVALGAQRALRVRHEFPGAGMIRELTAGGEAVRRVPPLAIRFNGDRYTPERIHIGGADELICEPLTRMAITRPLPPHRHARVTFGAARFRVGGEEGFGFYEYGRAVV